MLPFSRAEGTSMLQRMVGRRAEQLRLLMERGAFVGIRVPLPNGGLLPAEAFAGIAFGDLAYLTALRQDGAGHGDHVEWARLAESIELLHEAALVSGQASTERDRIVA
jgi:hypothetical protein